MSGTMLKNSNELVFSDGSMSDIMYKLMYYINDDNGLMLELKSKKINISTSHNDWKLETATSFSMDDIENFFYDEKRNFYMVISDIVIKDHISPYIKTAIHNGRNGTDEVYAFIGNIVSHYTNSGQRYVTKENIKNEIIAIKQRLNELLKELDKL